MAPARPGGENPSSERRRLSDITNSMPSVADDSENKLQDPQKGSIFLLHKEIARLKDKIEQKEAVVNSQKRELEKLWLNFCNKSRQNEEIIQRNGQLYKDLLEARDKIKIIGQENAIYKFRKNELGMQLKDVLEQLNSLKESKGFSQNKAYGPNIITKLSESRAKRIQNGYDNACEQALASPGTRGEGLIEDSTSNISCLRRRSSVNYKEASLKVKLRQEEHCSNHHVRKKSYPYDEGAGKQANIHVYDSTVEIANSADSTICSTSAALVEGCEPERNCSADAEIGIESREVQRRPASNVTEMAHLPRRNSSGRPMRKAAESIGSLKEPSLSIKMRRSE